MIWLYLLCLIFTIAGFVNGLFGLRSLRSKPHPEAEIAWKQDPLSPWRYETLTMIAIILHSLAIICLTVILTASVAGNYTFISYAKSGWTLFLSVAGIIFTSYVAGVIISFHFLQQWIKPVSYGVSKNGIWYGGTLTGWQSFNHYETSPEDGLISLYSSYSPSLRTWVMRPPADSFTNVLSIIQQNLPLIQSPGTSISWQRSATALIFGMSVLVLTAILPAAWAWLNQQAWTWIYCLVAFLLVLALGNKLITVFDGRGNAQVQKESVAQ